LSIRIDTSASGETARDKKLWRLSALPKTISAETTGPSIVIEGDFTVIVLDNELVKRKGKRYTVFKLLIEVGTKTWFVYRRYNHFHKLNSEVNSKENQNNPFVLNPFFFF